MAEAPAASSSTAAETVSVTPAVVKKDPLTASSAMENKLPRRNNYFQEDDIVWCKPDNLPFWPAEIIKAEHQDTIFTCRLFYPPEGTAIDLISSSAKIFYFDKLRTDEEFTECVEDRLQRHRHKVEPYEKNFVKACRRANDLVKIVMSPLKLLPFEVLGVGVVHSLMRCHVAAPRQPKTGTFEAQPAVIMMRPGLENAVRDLVGFDYVWVLFHFSYSAVMQSDSPPPPPKRKGSCFLPPLPHGWKTMVIPPRDTKLRGVFSTRSPHRPNSIGMSCVRLVDVVGLEVHIADHDLLHGTPVIDIKPYLPFCEAHPDAKAGWVTELDEAGLGGNDHRGSVGPPLHRIYDAERESEKKATTSAANCTAVSECK